MSHAIKSLSFVTKERDQASGAKYVCSNYRTDTVVVLFFEGQLVKEKSSVKLGSCNFICIRNERMTKVLNYRWCCVAIR